VSSRTTVELRFPRDVGTDAAVAVLRSLSGLRAGQRVALDTAADGDGIRHFLTTRPPTLAALRGVFRAELPGLRMIDAAPLDPARFTAAVRWRLTPRPGVLRDADAGRVGPALLAALQPLSDGERLLIRLVVGRGRAAIPAPNGSGSKHPVARARTRAVQAKAAEPMLRVRLVAAVDAGHPKRRDHLLGRISVVLRSLATPHGRLSGWRVPRFLAGRQLVGDGLGLLPDLLSATELAGLLAWPTDGPTLPGLSLGSAPLRMPSRSIPSKGRRIARANWPGAERDLCLSDTGALSHALVAGPTGTGKSALLLAGIEDTLASGHGALVIDGRGDLAEDVLARVGRRDVVVLDPGAGGPVPGLKLHGGRNDAELLADVVHGVLSTLFADSWGPLSERYVRLGLVTLAQDRSATLADFPFLFTDEPFRRRLVGRLKDPLLAAGWQAYEEMGASERAHSVAAPLGKVMSLIGRPSLRAVLGQADPKLDLAAAMRRGQLVVVNLATGEIGAPAARLLAALTVHALYLATQGRARITPRRRRPFFVSVDEPQILTHLPVPLDTLLEQARGLGVGLTISVQSVAQLPKAVRRAALTNAGTLVAFRQNADDARLLVRELEGVSEEDLQALGQFEVTARIGLGDGAIAPPATGTTYPPSPETSDPAAVRKASAERYGMEPAAVDAALLARHEQSSEDVPIGRTGRSS
jgi:DNA helicase HerA-like ATPase